MTGSAHDHDPVPPRSARGPGGKYLTLAILVAWVVAVFVFTLFKFSGGPK